MAFSILNWEKNEFLFVLIVVLVALGVSLTQLSWGAIKTRDAQRKADLDLIVKSLELYYDQHDMFPVGKDGKIMSCGKGRGVCMWGEDKIVDDEGVVYLEKLPTDPFSGKGWTYWYEPSNNLQGFRLYSGLENKRDPEMKQDLTNECGITIQCRWYVEK
jgi:hypothetical protein